MNKFASHNLNIISVSLALFVSALLVTYGVELLVSTLFGLG